MTERAEFDLQSYLDSKSIDSRGLIESPAYRRAITQNDPLLFGLIYLAKHLKGPETGDQITLSRFHLEITEHARQWIAPVTRPASDRDIWVAPRGVGKSTWWFLIIPMWAAAHGHRRFVAAFADTATQAESHLRTFRKELQRNKLINRDFPTLCATVVDTQSVLECESGFVFIAKGIDSTALGMKVEERRPDLLLCDDIEPDEANYSADQKKKRLSTVLDAILPLNIFARVVIVGTVTMAGSVIHDAVRTITQPGEEPEKWLTDENFRVHYYPALATDEESGESVSLWPGKWSVEFLLSIQHTRSFLKNYMNDPMGADGSYWGPEDFTYGSLPVFTHQLLSIDPAVTDKSKSDFTGFAVVAAHRASRTAMVRYAKAVRLAPGEPLRRFALSVLAEYPECSGILVETNQGGDMWKTVFHDMPIKVVFVHQSVPKDVRAARALHRYQRGRVLHEQRLPDAEAQMVGFPNAPHDDLVDAIGTGIDALLESTTGRGRSSSGSYAA
jgi:phage terminase large subunit-like protein